MPYVDIQHYLRDVDPDDNLYYNDRTGKLVYPKRSTDTESWQEIDDNDCSVYSCDKNEHSVDDEDGSGDLEGLISDMAALQELMRRLREFEDGDGISKARSANRAAVPSMPDPEANDEVGDWVRVDSVALPPASIQEVAGQSSDESGRSNYGMLDFVKDLRCGLEDDASAKPDKTSQPLRYTETSRVMARHPPAISRKHILWLIRLRNMPLPEHRLRAEIAALEHEMRSDRCRHHRAEYMHTFVLLE